MIQHFQPYCIALLCRIFHPFKENKNDKACKRYENDEIVNIITSLAHVLQYLYV